MAATGLIETPEPALGGAPDGFKTSGPPSLLSQPQHTKEPLHKVLAMGPGTGEGSYSKNNAGLAAMPKPELQVLAKALEEVTLPSRGPVVVADLGCSSGTNSIDNIALITDKLKLRMPKDAEFQACLNDLPSNDFNNLFQLWTSDSRVNDIFASGVPGSFYGRLFPRSSVHVFHSCMSLHWLSKVPDEVLDKDSPAYNKGQTWIMHSRSAVAEAYQKQAMEDLKNFLLARGAELVPGGVLVFYFLGSSLDPADPFNTTWGRYIGQDTNEIWSDLIAEGLLTEEQRDSFNFPVYQRNVEDVREAVASCGSLYHVLKVGQGKIEPSRTLDAERVKGIYKALFGVLLEANVGKNAADVIVDRIGLLADRKMGESPGIYRTHSEYICVVSLIRK